MKKASILFLIFFSIQSFAGMTNYVRPSDAESCMLGGSATYFTSKEECGKDCLQMDGEIECKDAQVSGDKLLLSPSKLAANKRARELEEQEEKAIKEAAETASARLESIDLKQTTVAGLKSELKAILVDLVKVIKAKK